MAEGDSAPRGGAGYRRGGQSGGSRGGGSGRSGGGNWSRSSGSYSRPGKRDGDRDRRDERDTRGDSAPRGEHRDRDQRDQRDRRDDRPRGSFPRSGPRAGAPRSGGFRSGGPGRPGEDNDRRTGGGGYRGPRGAGSRPTGGGGPRRARDDKPRGGYADRDRDRDRGYGDRNRGQGSRDHGDRDRRYGARDRDDRRGEDRGRGPGDRGYGNRDRGDRGRDGGYGDRNRGHGGRDRDGGHRDRPYGDRERSYGDRDRSGEGPRQSSYTRDGERSHGYRQDRPRYSDRSERSDRTDRPGDRGRGTGTGTRPGRPPRPSQTGNGSRPGDRSRPGPRQWQDRPGRPDRDASEGDRRAPRRNSGGTAPAIPDSITEDQVTREVKAELRGLPADLAGIVGRYLVASELAKDPEQAYRYAQAARDKAARIGVVREVTGIAAYRSGRWAEALAELRAARRLTGRGEYLSLMADSERALGRLDRALDLVRSEEARGLPRAAQIELRIVESGIRRDQGMADAAVLVLQVPELSDHRVRPWSARLLYAYGEALLAAGRPDEARDAFSRAVLADEDEETDAFARLDELDGITVDDLEDGDDLEDEEE